MGYTQQVKGLPVGHLSIKNLLTCLSTIQKHPPLETPLTKGNEPDSARGAMGCCGTCRTGHKPQRVSGTSGCLGHSTPGKRERGPQAGSVVSYQIC